MTWGVREGERGVCAHCCEDECGEEIEGWTEGKTWELASQHVRETGHAVMMHWRLFLDPLGGNPTQGPDGPLAKWELDLLRKQDHEHVTSAVPQDPGEPRVVVPIQPESASPQPEPQA